MPQRRPRLRLVDAAAGIFDGSPYKLLPSGTVYEPQPLVRKFDEDTLAVAESCWKLGRIWVPVPHNQSIRGDESGAPDFYGPLLMVICVDAKYRTTPRHAHSGRYTEAACGFPLALTALFAPYERG